MYVLMTGFSAISLPYSSTPAFFQPRDQVQLVGLVRQDGAPLVCAHLAVVERELAADDLAHAFFDGLQILRRKGALLAVLARAEIEVVIEARVDGRPDGNLWPREQSSSTASGPSHGPFVPDLVEIVNFYLVVVRHNASLIE
ncbi:MAG: hypothetical protein R2851_16295 [Caldilineaceae bacterium]